MKPVSKSLVLHCLEKEIQYHIDNKGKSGKTTDFEDGFVDGIRQAQVVINEIFGVKIPSELR